VRDVGSDEEEVQMVQVYRMQGGRHERGRGTSGMLIGFANALLVILNESGSH
jgi:hypothetical protein